MKYLCLVYGEESALQKMDDAHCLAYDQSIRDSGHCISSEALESVATATTVRVRRGEVSITDGPFAETKEVLAGFYMIEARDLDEAIRLASKIPPAEVGSIEVRPVPAHPDFPAARLMTSPGADDFRKAIEALKGGNKIEAIKLLRGVTDLGLAEAKAMVEKMEKELPPGAPSVGAARASSTPLRAGAGLAPGEVPRISGPAKWIALVVLLALGLAAAHFLGYIKA